MKYNYLRSCPYSVAEKVTSPVPVFSERTQKIDSIRKKSVYNTNIFFSEFLNPYFYPKVTASEFSEVDNLRKKMEDISSLNENGTFQTNWKKDNFNFITLRFKEKESVDYLIFKSSRYIKKPVILNGNMNIFDFSLRFCRSERFCMIKIIELIIIDIKGTT